jgi:hypothetical protein
MVERPTTFIANEILFLWKNKIIATADVDPSTFVQLMSLVLLIIFGHEAFG